MKTQLLLLAGAIILLLASCTDDIFIKGNGIPAMEPRLVPAFASVTSEGAFEVHVLPGNEHEVVVHAESNLMQFIETDVKEGHLRIHLKRMHGIKNRLPVEVFVKAPYIEGVVQSGSGSIKTGRLEGSVFHFVVSGSGSVETTVDAAELDAIVSGSGSLLLNGTARIAEISVSGSGVIDGRDFLTERCNAYVSGSGDVWVGVDQYLKAIVSGSGHIFYSGSPFIEMVVSGSGGVIHKN